MYFPLSFSISFFSARNKLKNIIELYTLQCIYLYSPKDCLQCHMYVYLIFKHTKDVILQIKSIAKSCILDSQESFMEIPNLYMDRRDHTM